MTTLRYTQNGTIAEFVGAKGELMLTSTPVYTFPDHKQYKQRDLKYHKKWDWLMPVIRKCYDIKEELSSDRGHHMYDLILRALKTVDLTHAHLETYYFILWYNKFNK